MLGTRDVMDGTVVRRDGNEGMPDAYRHRQPWSSENVSRIGKHRNETHRLQDESSTMCNRGRAVRGSACRNKVEHHRCDEQTNEASWPVQVDQRSTDDAGPKVKRSSNRRADSIDF